MKILNIITTVECCDELRRYLQYIGQPYYFYIYDPSALELYINDDIIYTSSLLPVMTVCHNARLLYDYDYTLETNIDTCINFEILYAQLNGNQIRHEILTGPCILTPIIKEKMKVIEIPIQLGKTYCTDQIFYNLLTVVEKTALIDIFIRSYFIKDYNDFKSGLTNYLKDSNLEIIHHNNNNILDLKGPLGARYKYDLRRFFKSISEYDVNCNQTLSDLIHFNIDVLEKTTTLTKDQLIHIFSKYQINEELLSRNNLNILVISRDAVFDKDYDIAFAFNEHKIRYNNKVIRLTFNQHIEELLDLFELARRSNVKSDELEWWHNSDPLSFETYAKYQEFCKTPPNDPKNIEFIGFWDINYSLSITPNCFKHKHLSKIINYYKGNIYFLKKSMCHIQYTSPDFSQDICDGVGHFLLAFLIRTKNNIFLSGFSDIVDVNLKWHNHSSAIQRIFLTNLLLYIKRISKV